MQLRPSLIWKENLVDNMIFYWLELQMPSRGLQTKNRIHCKHKWIIITSPKLQTSNEI
jgi:hypothetical protein